MGSRSITVGWTIAETPLLLNTWYSVPATIEKNHFTCSAGFVVGRFQGRGQMLCEYLSDRGGRHEVHSRTFTVSQDGFHSLVQPASSVSRMGEATVTRPSWAVTCRC